jgi:hypothetical protein
LLQAPSEFSDSMSKSTISAQPAPAITIHSTRGLMTSSAKNLLIDFGMFEAPTLGDQVGVGGQSLNIRPLALLATGSS